jgi:protoheme IX farnesyltransferase
VSVPVAVGAPTLAARAADFVALTKPRITLLVVLTTLVGYWTGHTGRVDVALLVNTLFGTALVAAAASALNQYAEWRSDAAMRRTARRPLPARRLEPHVAFGFGIVLFAFGAAWLRLMVNPLASFLAIVTSASYMLAHTPLKKVRSPATGVGAVPGAIPPMIGWAAARDSLGAEAWVLFLIVFLWQMPHFLAIAALYRRDYEAAGFQMLPVVDKDGASTGRQAVLYALALIPVSLLPAFLGMAGPVYFVGALALGVCFLAAAVHFMARVDDAARARRLFRFSLLYLPAVLALLVAA